MKDTKRSLVAYFSCSGVTEALAKSIADVSGADLYEIKPEIPYTSADLNWMDNESRSTVEMKDPNFRPAIATRVSNMDDYDVVFVGYPDWWSDAPMVIYSFLESYDWTGKTLIPFCTSGGSGFGRSLDQLEASAPDAAIEEGLHVPGSSVDGATAQVADWVNGLNLG